MITLTSKQWRKIHQQLKEEYVDKPSIFLIRETMKRELGFTTRFHKTYSHQHGTQEIVYLDFYNDPAETMFRLKYL
jgi:hypothetical protein